MKIHPGKQQKNYLNPFLILFVFFSVIIFWYASDLYSKSHASPKNHDKISFEDRLAFYLDQKSKTFLTDMAVNEKLLLQMIQNITRELKARGKTAIIDKEIGRPELYSNADTLIAQYSNELNALLEIIAEITQLEKVVEQHNDVSAWESLAALREKVIRLLDNRNLHLDGTSDNIQRHASALLKEYYAEIDSVLALYRSLSQLEREARTQGDNQIVEEIAVQKEWISDLLGNLTPSKTDSLADNYLHETKLLINILKELEDLQSQAFQQNSKISFEIEDFRRSLLLNLDKRLLSLMGYHSSLPINGPNVSEIFKEWIASQYANYEIQFTQYQLLKNSLLQNATEAQRARMLEMDLESAYLNYVDLNFTLAQKQFDLIIQDYGESFESFAIVLFYRAESFFIRYLYDEAAQDYNRIVSEFPGSEYFGESLFRLMLISQKRGEMVDFSKYFDMLASQSDNIEKEYFDKSSYLAGYVNIKNSNFTAAQEILSRISNDSKYYIMARYLLGIVFVNQQNYANAIEIFKDLAGLKKNLLPGSVESFVRNNALLKLGFIYYEKDDYEEALNYFNQVSPRFADYGKSLLGAAWTYLKQRNYAKTIENANLLFQYYESSDYIYEALVLSAHSKKILKQKESALKDLRYVSNARKALELSEQYNSERKFILNQLNALERLEDKILERRDKHLYTMTSQIRDHLQKMLLQFQYRELKGSLDLENIENERKNILNQIAELNQFISRTYENTDKELATEAHYQYKRLIRSMDVYQTEGAVENVNSFLDYPLATKEGGVKYRKGILTNLMNNIELERQKIQKNIQQIQSLQKRYNRTTNNVTTKLDMELLQNRLKELKKQSSQFSAWLAENQTTEINTDFNQRADFSGFGMSDRTFNSIIDKETKISELANNNNSITQLFQDRKKFLEQKLVEYDREMKRLEVQLKQERLEKDRQNREQYIRDSYFDTKEREVKEKESPDPDVPDNSIKPN